MRFVLKRRTAFRAKNSMRICDPTPFKRNCELYETVGFWLDLARELAAENGVKAGTPSG